MNDKNNQDKIGELNSMLESLENKTPAPSTGVKAIAPKDSYSYRTPSDTFSTTDKESFLEKLLFVLRTNNAHCLRDYDQFILSHMGFIWWFRRIWVVRLLEVITKWLWRQIKEWDIRRAYRIVQKNNSNQSE